MKKFLSTIIIMALALALALPLSSCAAQESEGVSETTIMSYKKEQPMRRSDSDIESIISVEFGYTASRIDLQENAPQYLDGLYYSSQDVYFAYINLYTDTGLLESEVIAKIYPDRPFEYAYLTILGSTTDRLYKALRQAANYVLSRTLDEDKVNQLIVNKYIERFGECNSFRGYHTFEQGVKDLYYSDEFNTYIAYIDTFDMRSHNTGIKALVVIRDNIILEVDVLAYCFADDIDNFPADYEVKAFFEQYTEDGGDTTAVAASGKNKGIEVHAAPIKGCEVICNDFTDAINDVNLLKLKMSNNLLDKIKYFFLGNDNPLYFVIIAVVIFDVVVIASCYLLILPLMLIALILLIVIIIISVSKRKLKKKLRALKQKAEAPVDDTKKEPTEKTEEAKE